MASGNLPVQGNRNRQTVQGKPRRGEKDADRILVWHADTEGSHKTRASQNEHGRYWQGHD